MTKAPEKLQDLQRKIYAKAKAEPSWRFWGLYVPRLQTGNAPHRLSAGQSERWRSGN